MRLFGKKYKKAAVLGCGPAGMFATHAFMQMGWEVEVYSKMRESELFGAQYLHAPIPGLAGQDSPEMVNYTLRGTSDGYRQKVYGSQPEPVGFVSVDRLKPHHAVWDIRRAYRDAYEKYGQLIIDTPSIDGGTVWAMFAKSDHHVIFNTIPLPALCQKGHQFRSQEIWAIGDAPERGKYAPFTTEPWTVVCNGDPEQAWYRASNVFGYNTVEYPNDRIPPLPGGAMVQKPIGHSCDCWARFPKFWTGGRYGRWDKAELSHMAYQRVMQEIR